MRASTFALAAIAPLVASQTYTSGYQQAVACRNSLASNVVFTIVNGTSGSSGAVTIGTSAPSVISSTPASCPGYAMNGNGKHVWAVVLGDDTYWGGSLIAMTCSPSTVYDSVIYVGSGCPSSGANFNCMNGNDDSATCTNYPGGSASLMSFTETAGINTGVMYVLVSSYSALTASSTYDFTWSYSGGAYPPSPSNSPTPSQTPSNSPTPSQTPTRSLAAGASPSNTATVSITGTPTLTSTPSITASVTRTPTQSGTPDPASQTSTPSSTNSVYPSTSNTKTNTASNSATRSTTSSITPSRPATASTSNTGSLTVAPTPSITQSAGGTPGSTTSQTASNTGSNTGTVSGSITASPPPSGAAPSTSGTPSSSVTGSGTSGSTGSSSPTGTGSVAGTQSVTPSPVSPTSSVTPSSTQTPSNTMSEGASPPGTPLWTPTRTRPRSGTPSGTVRAADASASGTPAALPSPKDDPMKCNIEFDGVSFPLFKRANVATAFRLGLSCFLNGLAYQRVKFVEIDGLDGATLSTFTSSEPANAQPPLRSCWLTSRRLGEAAALTSQEPYASSLALYRQQIGAEAPTEQEQQGRQLQASPSTSAVPRLTLQLTVTLPAVDGASSSAARRQRLDDAKTDPQLLMEALALAGFFDALWSADPTNVTLSRVAARVTSWQSSLVPEGDGGSGGGDNKGAGGAAALVVLVFLFGGLGYWYWRKRKLAAEAAAKAKEEAKRKAAGLSGGSSTPKPGGGAHASSVRGLLGSAGGKGVTGAPVDLGGSATYEPTPFEAYNPLAKRP